MYVHSNIKGKITMGDTNNSIHYLLQVLLKISAMSQTYTQNLILSSCKNNMGMLMKHCVKHILLFTYTRSAHRYPLPLEVLKLLYLNTIHLRNY